MSYLLGMNWIFTHQRLEYITYILMCMLGTYRNVVEFLKNSLAKHVT